MALAASAMRVVPQSIADSISRPESSTGPRVGSISMTMLGLFCAEAGVPPSPTATNSANRTNQTCRVYLMSPFLLEEDPPVCSRSSSLASLLARGALRRFHLLLELGLECFEVEARALLHRRKLEERLRRLGNLLLDVGEAPELEHEPVVVRDRPVVPAVVHARALERIKTEVD